MLFTLKKGISSICNFLYKKGAWKNFLFVIAASLLFKANFKMFIMTGPSMNPSLSNFKMFLISDFEREVFGIRVERYDVVIFEDEHGDLVVKRIVGMPTEKVQIKQGRIYVNGKLKDFNYLKFNELSKHLTTGRFDLWHGEYFYVGDNRGLSSYGVVKENDIIGRIK